MKSHARTSASWELRKADSVAQSKYESLKTSEADSAALCLRPKAQENQEPAGASPRVQRPNNLESDYQAMKTES